MKEQRIALVTGDGAAPEPGADPYSIIEELLTGASPTGASPTGASPTGASPTGA